ncbi:MAG: hypothetical protein ACRCYT_07665, partial [Cetobacterium sp.]
MYKVIQPANNVKYEAERKIEECLNKALKTAFLLTLIDNQVNPSLINNDWTPEEIQVVADTLPKDDKARLLKLTWNEIQDLEEAIDFGLSDEETGELQWKVKKLQE